MEKGEKVSLELISKKKNGGQSQIQKERGKALE